MLLFTNENHTGSLRSEINALQHASFLETLTGTSDQRPNHDDLPILACKDSKNSAICFLFEEKNVEKNKIGYNRGLAPAIFNHFVRSSKNNRCPS